ncbi:hypothetical protein LINPERPRIM_LOCUS24545 [Linum perenne]
MRLYFCLALRLNLRLLEK